MQLSTLAAASLATTLGLGSATAYAVTDAEFNKLKARFEQLADAMESRSGGNSDTSIGSYGELHYNNYGNQGKQIDFHRFVLFINHEFTDDIRVFSEFELEHSLAGEGKPGEVELEQAYIQFDIDDDKTLNAGLFLIPVGIINETHEPATFYGVERNPIESNIIPATWWEAGVMFSGRVDSGISYDVAMTSGLAVDAATINIRSGRQKVAQANADNLAVTGRVKYTGAAGLEIAGTLQLQSDVSQIDSDNVDGATLIEGHVIWNNGPVSVRVLHAMWDVNGTAAAAQNKDSQSGTYVEGSYRLNPSAGVFARYNTWDNGGVGDTDKNQTNVGFNYWPHENVVVKFDLQVQDSNAGDNDGFNLGIGYHF